MNELYEQFKKEAKETDYARRQNANFWTICLLFCASSFDFSIGEMPYPNFQLSKNAADSLYRLILDESQHRRKGDEQFIRELRANMKTDYQPNLVRLTENLKIDYNEAEQIFQLVAQDVKKLAATI